MKEYDCCHADGFMSCSVKSVPRGEALINLCNAHVPVPMKIEHFGDISLTVSRYRGTESEHGRCVIIEGAFAWMRRRSVLSRLRSSWHRRYEEVRIAVRVDCFPDREDGPKGIVHIL